MQHGIPQFKAQQSKPAFSRSPTNLSITPPNSHYYQQPHDWILYGSHIQNFNNSIDKADERLGKSEEITKTQLQPALLAVQEPFNVTRAAKTTSVQFGRAEEETDASPVRHDNSVRAPAHTQASAAGAHECRGSWMSRCLSFFSSSSSPSSSSVYFFLLPCCPSVPFLLAVLASPRTQSIIFFLKTSQTTLLALGSRGVDNDRSVTSHQTLADAEGTEDSRS